MAHTTEIAVNGTIVPVTEFDSTAQQIDDAVAALGAASTPQQALANLGAGVRPNLFDNPYFVGGGSQQGGGQLPINPYGQTDYTGNTQAVSRWKTVSNGSISLEEDGITLTQSGGSIWVMAQTVSQSLINYLKGKEITISALDSQNNLHELHVSSAFTGEPSVTAKVSIWCSVSGYIFFGTNEPSVKLAYVKLEEGPDQTLAYKDAGGTWHRIPQSDMDYATQFTRCRHYLLTLENITTCPGGVEGDDLIFGINFPTEMRVAPTFIPQSGGNNLQLYVNGSAGFYPNVEFSLQWVSRTGATIKCKSPITLSPQTAISGRIDGKLMFSAEL